MRRQIIILVVIIMAISMTASAQIILRPPPSFSCIMWDICLPPHRAIPNDPRPYRMPRSVGAWSQYNDMSMAPLPWWPLTTGRPFWQTLDKMRDDHGLTAVGFKLRAHPTIGYWENIRKAFRTDDIDVLALWLVHWASTEPKFDCDKSFDGSTSTQDVPDEFSKDGVCESVVWQNLPTGKDWQFGYNVFEDLYRVYGGQDKVVIVMTFESDNRLHGKGCQDRDKCVPWGWYWNDCPAVCEEQRGFDPEWPVNFGWWFPENYVRPDDCRSICCDMNKAARRNYMLWQFNNLQAASVAARANHPDAKLRVIFSVELDRYDRQGEWMTTGKHILPFMDSLEGMMIGLSCWPEKCGDTSEEVLESFQLVQEWTGLPAHRFFVAEVGAKEKYVGRQYDRIMTVVDPLFKKGVAFALVWSLEQSSPDQQTLHALIDPETGEYRSGMAAIRELNEVYR